jgi:nitrous oxide reductase accessory protein NosL
MKKQQTLLGWMVILLVASVLIPAAVWAQETVFDKADQYHFCHRCGMAIKKNGRVITVNNVPEAPWYQCCPVCAVMDIIESANGSGSIKGYDHTDGQPIHIVITENDINKVDPPGTTILVGGSCPKNKFFADRATGEAFVQKTDWAEPKMLKSVPQVLAFLTDKQKAITRCAMCSTALAGHEKTHFTIMTKDKKRLVACCGHCGMLMMHKLKDKAMRAVTPDFGTGQLIDAKNAFYVVDNDLVVCCYPSTISFAKRSDAEAFQKKHKGVIMTFAEGQSNMKKVMGK